MSRPSEAISGIVGSIVGACLSLLVAFEVNVPDGVAGPLVILVSWVAAGVTLVVARKQRAGAKVSNADGTVA